MDLSSLQKIATKSGAQVGGLKEGKAGAGNQDFLSRTQAAESTLAQKQASISANTAVLDAKLSGKIADEFINSEGHKNFLKAQADQAAKSSLLNQEMESLYKNSKAYNEQLAKTAQNEMVSGIKENLLSGLSMVLGGVAASFATKGVGILGKGLQTMFSKVSGGGGGGVTSMATSMLGGGGGAPPVPGGGGGGGMMPSMPGGGGGSAVHEGGAGVGESGASEHCADPYDGGGFGGEAVLLDEVGEGADVAVGVECGAGGGGCGGGRVHAGEVADGFSEGLRCDGICAFEGSAASGFEA